MTNQAMILAVILLIKAATSRKVWRKAEWNEGYRPKERVRVEGELKSAKPDCFVKALFLPLLTFEWFHTNEATHKRQS